VIVMDNASYHSVKAESCPTSNWNKNDIEKWLEEKGEVYEKPKIKPRLMDIVNSIKPRYNQYLIDEYVKKHNKVILRIPPYHCYQFKSSTPEIDRRTRRLRLLQTCRFRGRRHQSQEGD